MKYLNIIIVFAIVFFVSIFLLFGLEHKVVAEFMPHGHCYRWQPNILSANIIGNTLTALSYFTIPIMIYIYSRRKNVRQYKGFFRLFGMFIFSCGIGHVINISDIFFATYNANAISIIITGILSVVTAVGLTAALPSILKDLSKDEISQLARVWKIKSELFSDPFFIHKDNILIYTSPSFGEFFGYTMEEVNELPFKFLSLLDEYSRERKKEVQKTGKTGRNQYVIITKSGKRKHVEFNSTAFNLDSGIGRAVIVKDITDIVLLASALELGTDVTDIAKRISDTLDGK